MRESDALRNLNIEEEYGKIVVEDGFDFLAKLKAEAKRQKEIKGADMTNAFLSIEELPLEDSILEENQLAESFDIIEE